MTFQNNLEPPEWEDFEGESDDVDLRLYQLVGEILYFDFLHTPPQPKLAKGWAMTIGILFSLYSISLLVS